MTVGNYDIFMQQKGDNSEYCLIIKLFKKLITLHTCTDQE